MRPGSSPLVAVTACARQLDLHPSLTVTTKYLNPIIDAVGALPFIVPALEPPLAPAQILPMIDGLLVTGSPSNVAPALYGGPESAPGTLHDHRRDATSIPLIRAAIDEGVPVFAICRGIQELNVATGGTLFQKLPPSTVEHNCPSDEAPLDEQYGHRHVIDLTPGGYLATLLDADRVWVNSLHNQGLDRLGAGLVVAARAPDGIVEAVHMPAAPGFVLGVQWHPEYGWATDPVSRRLFQAFREAVAAHAEKRGRP